MNSYTFIIEEPTTKLNIAHVSDNALLTEHKELMKKYFQNEKNKVIAQVVPEVSIQPQGDLQPLAAGIVQQPIEVPIANGPINPVGDVVTQAPIAPVPIDLPLPAIPEEQPVAGLQEPVFPINDNIVPFPNQNVDANEEKSKDAVAIENPAGIINMTEKNNVDKDKLFQLIDATDAATKALKDGINQLYDISETYRIRAEMAEAKLMAVKNQYPSQQPIEATNASPEPGKVLSLTPPDMPAPIVIPTELIEESLKAA